MQLWTLYRAAPGRTYCFPVAATTAGNIGEVKKTGDGGGTLTTDGSPTNAFSIIVKITAQGGLNTAAFTVSIDGGKIFAEETTVPLNGSHEIAGTGVKVKFAEATEESQKPSSFLVNDTYTFETTGSLYDGRRHLGSDRQAQDLQRGV